MTLAYVVKMFPRLSETFILNEILALEAKGLKVRIFSLKPSDSRWTHQELAYLHAQVNYLPESVLRYLPRMLAAQAHFLVHYPGRWARAFSLILRRKSLRTGKRWLQAGIAAQIIEGSDVSHIHAHFAHSPTTVSMIMGILLELPFSFTAHAKDIFHKDNHYDMLELKMNRARFVVTVTDFNRLYLTDLNPAAEAKLHVVRNGLPLARFPLRKDEPQGRRILAVGRLVEKKGFPTLVEACALLASRGIRFECDIAGTGPERSRIEKNIKRHKLEDYVHLLGAVDDVTLRNLYSGAAVFALPCRVASTGDKDGMPTVLIEAMALGVAVVTTHVTGIPELVIDGCTGLLVPPDDAAALADALENALSDPDMRRRLALEARKKVEEEYQIEANIVKLMALFARDDI